MDLVVVGLGNVGVKYALNRHNVGFMVVDYIANREGLEFLDYPSVLLAKGRGFYLVKPKLFMNNSGKALLSAPIPIKNMPILVIYDDADLPFGKVKFKIGIKSIPSHRGLRDIYESLNRSDIMRLRVGISRPPEGVDLADWVLSDFSEEELKLLPGIFEKSYEVVKLVARGKVELVGRVLS